MDLMIIININRTLGTPIYQQIVEKMRELIDNGVLRPGEKLPSTRELAEKLGVNRSTVYLAYEELWVTGYIQSNPGSYTFVRRKRTYPFKDETSIKTAIDWSACIDKRIDELYTRDANSYEKTLKFPREYLDMKSISPDERLYPVKTFKVAFNAAVKENMSKMFSYSDIKGYLPLRTFLSAHLKKHGIQADINEIIITNGSQNSLDLITRLLLSDGSTVAAESPTYASLYNFLRMHRCNVQELSLNETGGYDFSFLEKCEKPAFFYTTPNFQNPTGYTMSQQDRENLLKKCQELRVPIIEDGFEEEMKYFGKSPLSIKAMDTSKIVIYTGSFSKVLFPGMRIGWIVADKPLIDRITFLKNCSDISSGQIMQAAAFEFCQRGYFDEHIRKLKRVYKKRMSVFLSQMDKVIQNPDVSWTKPLGGYTSMITFNNVNSNIQQVHQIFLDHGISPYNGNDFFFKPQEKIHFRLSIAKLNEEEIEKAVDSLSKVIHDVYSRH